MATAVSHEDLSEKIKESLTCSICCDLLKEPKDLDCHVFCLECLQQMVEEVSEHYLLSLLTITCPECHHITIVPQEGLSNLKTNLRLKTLVEKYAEGANKNRAVLVCPNHEGERQHFFCVTCGITVFRDCLVLDHPQARHDIKELKDVIKTQLKTVKTKIEHVQEEMKRTQKQNKELSEMKQKLEVAKGKAKNDIKKHFKLVMTEVEASECDMMALLEKNYQKNLKMLNEKQNHADDLINRLENVHSTAQNVIDTAADHNLLQHASLVDQMDNLCLTHQSGEPSLDLDSFVFNPGYNFEDTSWFGHVGACRQPWRTQINRHQSKSLSVDIDSRINSQFSPGVSTSGTRKYLCCF